MHKILSISELLDNIFTFADEETNANNVCVCKQWSEICLDRLWHDVHDISRLFRILSPLKRVESSTYMFKTKPMRNDWERFETYCQLVRRLSLSDRDCLRFKDILDVIGRNRLTLNFLPNLHTLELVGTADDLILYSVMFMHENIKRFAVSIAPHQNISSYVEDIIGRMSMLTHLEFQSDYTEAVMLKLIHGLPHLHTIFLLPCQLTSRITEDLSHLPNLVNISYLSKLGRGYYRRTFEPSLVEGAFPSLNQLALVVDFSELTKFFSSPFPPANLTALRVESHSLEETSEMHKLLVAVAENCKLLTELSFSPNLYGYRNQKFEEERVTLDILRPILSCPKITTFEITHQNPLALQLDDIEEIASKWPSIEKLILNNNIAAHSETHEYLLTLRSLLPFARHCPQLQHLGLFLCATTIDLPTTHGLQSFQMLKRLSMGSSPLTEEGAVALFLSQICPIGCRVVSGPAVDLELQHKWETVDHLLPLLTKLRMEGLQYGCASKQN